MQNNLPVAYNGDVNAEEAVIGACLLDTGALKEALQILKPKYFTAYDNQTIFRACQELYHENIPVDTLSVDHRIKSYTLAIKISGEEISKKTNYIASGANVRYHSFIVLEWYLRRVLEQYSRVLNQRSLDTTYEMFESIETLYEKYKEILEIIDALKSQSNQSVIADIKKNLHSPVTLVSIKSFYNNLAKYFNYFKKELTIIAARPGMGKTSFTLMELYRIAVRDKKPIAFISLEMSKEQLIIKICCALAKIQFQKYRDNKCSNEEKAAIDKELDNFSPHFIIEDPDEMTSTDLRMKLIYLVIKYKIVMVAIDYLQLLKSDSKFGTRDEEIGVITKTIKGLTRQLNIPIILLCQLSREVEKRNVSNYKPKLSDLRESGNIEQDADNVLFIYRPEYYGLTSDDKGNSLLNLAEIIIAKHRNGAPNKKAKLKFIGEYTDFEDLVTVSMIDQTTTPTLFKSTDEEDENLRF
jgi:replicative DNA helicase